MSRIPIVLSLLLFSSLLQAAKSAERWYSQAQAKAGEPLFAKHCAVCHGEKAQAIGDWRKADNNGFFPAPALDGSAHAWHHALELLRSIINKGGAPVGGRMPGFANTLSEAEIDSIIAYFQNLWPEQTYQKWAKIDGTVGLKPKQQKAADAKKSVNPLLRLLQKAYPNSKLSAPLLTPVKGLFQVKVNKRYFYVIGNGQFAVSGDLINLQTGQILTPKQD